MSDRQPATGPAPRGRERRRHRRFEVLGRVLGTLVSEDLPVRIRDVGQGGFSAETVEPLDTGAEHAVRFTAVDDWTAELPARSLHCRPSVAEDGSPRYVTGFEFIQDRVPDFARVISDLLEKVTSTRPLDNGWPQGV